MTENPNRGLTNAVEIPDNWDELSEEEQDAIAMAALNELLRGRGIPGHPSGT